jgi:hypothetical protein
MDVDLQTEKNVFVVFYAGEKVKGKILKICDAFGANRYPFAEELGKQAQMISEVCILVVISLEEKFLYLPPCHSDFYLKLLLYYYFTTVHTNLEPNGNKFLG